MVMQWRPVFKDCSLPYNQGDRFLMRKNKCFCEIEEPNIIKCLKNDTCVDDFIVLNEQSFSKINATTGSRQKSITYSKQNMYLRYKYWAIIHPDPSARKDIFVCKCMNTYVPRFIGDDSKNCYKHLECCHCKQLVLRCSDHCINALRGG
jgi:hypothetical protein